MINLNDKNPLDRFRSYSYHYFMVGCASSYDMTRLIGDSGRPSRLDAILSAAPGQKIDLGEGTNSYLILDTRRFSAFNISSFDMTHMYGSGDIDNPTVPLAEMNMVLKDSTGISFYNLLWNVVQNKLKSSLTNTFYVLGITFVGHRDDGGTEEISFSYIPCVLTGIEFNFGTSEAEYRIQLFEIDGAIQKAGNFEHLENIYPVGNVTTQNRSNTLGGFIECLEEKLNIASSDYYVKSKTLNASKGKLVQYMITIPDEWKDFVPSKAQKASHDEKIIKRDNREVSSSDKTAYHILNFDSSKTNITQAIKRILETCPDFLKLTDEKAEKRYVFKTLTNLTSSESLFMIHFDIYPVILPPKDEKGFFPTDPTVVKNLMEFDYIFTGKNKDILDLNIRYGPEAIAGLDSSMNIGQARLNKASATGQIATNVKKEGEASIKPNEIKIAKFRENDPLLMPPHDKLSSTNSCSIRNPHLPESEAIEDIKSRRQYENTMAFMHFVSSIELDVKIRGNPLLIKKYADALEKGIASPSTISKKDLDNVSSISGGSLKAVQDATANELKKSFIGSKEQYKRDYYNKRKNSASSLNPDIAASGLYAKINIKAPNVDTSGQFLRDKEGAALEPYYTSNFFYDGLYLVAEIKTSLNDGKFEHDLKLVAIDIDRVYKS